MEKETEKQGERDLRLKADLEGNYLIDKQHQAEKNIGIFYAPSGGSVHRVARLLKQKLSDYRPEMFCITEIDVTCLLDYHHLILVCSTLGRNTWEMEQKDPWSAFLPKLRRIRLNDRFVAIVGLGDHVSYPANFVDGMATLATAVEEAGAQLIGETGTQDYVFDDSRALRNGQFVGLPLDEDYEKEKTEERINRWLEQIRPELEGKEGK